MLKTRSKACAWSVLLLSTALGAEPIVEKAPLGVVEVIDDFESGHFARRYAPSRWTAEQRAQNIIGEATDDAKFGKGALRCYTGNGRKRRDRSGPLYEGVRFSPYVMPPEADCITFWAKVEGPPVVLHSQFSTAPCSSIADVTVSSSTWKQYTLNFADIHRKVGRSGEEFYQLGSFLPDIYIENDILLCPIDEKPSEESVVTIDQIQYENHGGGRVMERRIQQDDSRFQVVRVIDDFESGTEKMMKGLWWRSYYAMMVCKQIDGTYKARYPVSPRHNWTDSETVVKKLSVSPDARNGRFAGHISAAIGDEGQCQVGWDCADVPDGANGLALWFRTLGMPESKRQTFFVHVWCVPEDRQHLAQTPTPGLSEPSGGDYCWGFNHDLEGAIVDLPRAMYSALIDLKGRDPTQWHRIVIPFRDFSFIWSYKMPDRPIQREEIVRVAFRNSFKNHYSTNDLFIDDLCLVNITDLEGNPFPAESPANQFTTYRALARARWEKYLEDPAATSWEAERKRQEKRRAYESRQRTAKGAPVDIVASEQPIKVDGDPGDWEGIASMPLPFTRADRSSFKLCWHENGLYGLVVAKDAAIGVDPEAPWEGDSVEIFVEKDAARSLSMTEACAQYIFSPNPDARTGKGHVLIAYGSDRDKQADIQCMWKPIASGYALEFNIPATALTPAQMKAGTELGMNMALNDGGKPVEQFYSDKNVALGWQKPSTWGTVTLGER